MGSKNRQTFATVVSNSETSICIEGLLKSKQLQLFARIKTKNLKV